MRAATADSRLNCNYSHCSRELSLLHAFVKPSTQLSYSHGSSGARDHDSMLLDEFLWGKCASNMSIHCMSAGSRAWLRQGAS